MKLTVKNIPDVCKNVYSNHNRDTEICIYTGIHICVLFFF